MNPADGEVMIGGGDDLPAEAIEPLRLLSACLQPDPRKGSARAVSAT
jgi:hypothetical protein